MGDFVQLGKYFSQAKASAFHFHDTMRHPLRVSGSNAEDNILSPESHVLLRPALNPPLKAGPGALKGCKETPRWVSSLHFKGGMGAF